MAKRKDNVVPAYAELVGLLHDYIDELGAELHETAPIAAAHGWESSRYKTGLKMRKKIAALEKRLHIKEGRL